jgi:hypothetical protein
MRAEGYTHHFTIKKGTNYWGLVFCSNHSLGMEKFLKVCWNHDEFSGESNCNINNDFIEGTLFYNLENTNIKERVKKDIKNKILSKEIKENISGLKYAMRCGCLPKLFSDTVKELEKDGIIKRVGNVNFASTNIHKLSNKQYRLEVIS